jgi:hypothetical protein
LQDVAVDEAEKPDVAITRGDAFKAARKAGKKTFSYGGKEYTTELKKSGMTDAFTKDVAARKAMPEVTVTGRRKSADIEEAPTRGSMSADTTGAQREKDKRTTAGLAGAVMGPIAESGTALATSGLGAIRGVRAARSAGMLEDEAASMVKKGAEKAAAKKAAEREGRAAREAAGDIASDKRTAKFREKLRQGANRKRIAESPGILDRGRAPSDSDLSGVIGGYKKGGKIKKYARGGGIESRGKTKGRVC